jgi:gliding-associated putative ABC transporter substrate-binding component GldG
MSGAQRERRREQGILLLLSLVVIVLAAFDTARFFARLDLSANRMYSLSEVSRKIVRDLPDQLSVTYYVSEKLAARYPFPAQVTDMLREFAAYSRGRMSVAVEDPAKGKRPVQPESLGLVAQQMQVVEKQEINVATVYSGVVLQYLDRVETLPFVADVATLEYDMASRIRTLQTKEQRVVGILLGDSRKSFQSDYRNLVQELQSMYQLLPVQAGGDIPPSVTTLFVVGSRDLDVNALYPIDQFIMNGGKALFAASPVDVDLQRGLTASTEGRTDLFDMLAGYGVKVPPELLLDSLNQRISFRLQQNRLMIVSYPHWVAISGKTVSRTNPVTSRFSGLDLYWPSPLEIVAREGVKAETLVSSSPDSWIMRGSLETNPALSNSPEVQNAGPRGQHPLAVALSGTFTSFFADRPAPSRPGEKARPAPLSRSRDTRLVVVGDAAFASDMLQYTNAGYNIAFLSNCADWLGREDDLLSIKTRSQVDVRLNRIADPAAKARAMLTSQIVTVVIVPLLVVAFGVLRLLRRRARRGDASRDTP